MQLLSAINLLSLGLFPTTQDFPAKHPLYWKLLLDKTVCRAQNPETARLIASLNYHLCQKPSRLSLVSARADASSVAQPALPNLEMLNLLVCRLPGSVERSEIGILAG